MESMGRKQAVDFKHLNLTGENAKKVLASLLNDLSIKELENLAEQLLVNDTNVDLLLNYCRDPKKLILKPYNTPELYVGKNVYVDVLEWKSQGTIDSYQKKGLKLVHNRFLLIEIAFINIIDSSPNYYILEPENNNGLERVYQGYFKSIEDIENIVNENIDTPF